MGGLNPIDDRELAVFIVSFAGSAVFWLFLLLLSAKKISDKMRPCPRCGGKGLVHLVVPLPMLNYRYEISCDGCDARMTVHHSVERGAMVEAGVKAWNSGVACGANLRPGP